MKSLVYLRISTKGVCVIWLVNKQTPRQPPTPSPVVLLNSSHGGGGHLVLGPEEKDFISSVYR